MTSLEKPLEVVLIGTPFYRTCASCQQGRTMREMAMLLGKRLDLLFGSQVKYRYVDATTDDIRDFPDLAEAIRKGKMPLPVTLIDGKPLFPGLYSPTMIVYQVKQALNRVRPEGQKET